MWWKKKTPQRILPTEPTAYPSGTVVETETGFFLIKDGRRYRLPTQRILDSWNFPLIVPTTDVAVSHYPIRGKIGFRDGSLIHNIADGKMYVISKNKRPHIEDPDALDLLGVTKNDFLLVSDFEISLQEEGESIG